MPQEEKRSRPIYRKADIDIDGRDYAIDLYEGEFPPISEGDKVILRDRAGLYYLLLVEKEDSDDKKCDKDHHYCHKHNRCERIDHDCDDKDHPPHDPDLDRRILDDIDYQTKLIKEILDDVRTSGHDGDIDRKLIDITEAIKKIVIEVDADSDKDLELSRKILNTVLALTNTCNTILSILQNSPPPPPIPIPPPPPPTPSPPPSPPPSPSPPPAPKEQSHTRVIIQGEFDVPHPEITEENKPEDPEFQRQLVEKFVNQMKKEQPAFKITKTLVARGIGPVKVAW